MRRLLALLATCLLCSPAYADLGYVDQGNAPWSENITQIGGNAVGATIPISGTVTATLPNPLPVSLPSGSQPVVETQGATLLNSTPVVSSVNASTSVSLAGAANQRVCIRSIAIYATGLAGAVTLTVQDGAGVIMDLGAPSLPLLGPATIFGGALLACGSTGNGMTVNIGAGGLTEVTHTSVIADRQ